MIRFGKEKIKKNRKKFYFLPKKSFDIDYKNKINKVVSNLKKKERIFNLLLPVRIMPGYLTLEGEMQNIPQFHTVIF